MNWIEEILIISGISLDIFGAMACQGAVVAKLEKKRLAALCSLVALWQLAALALGATLSNLLQKQVTTGYETLLGEVIAAVIFLGLGIRLLKKAWKNEGVVEKREERPDWKRTVVHLAITSIYTFLTGVAFGFIGFHMAAILIMILCISVAVVLLGMYTGYWLGFEHKLQAYILGAVLLGAAGIDVIVRYIVL